MRFISCEGLCFCDEHRDHWDHALRNARAIKRLAQAGPDDITLVPIDRHRSNIYVGQEKIGTIENDGFSPETPPVQSYSVNLDGDPLGPYVFETTDHAHIALREFLNSR